jgi:hypothetical protein
LAEQFPKREIVISRHHSGDGVRPLSAKTGMYAATELVRDGAVSSPHRDLLLLPASPRCILCTTRPQQLDGGSCRADGRALQIGTHIFFFALPLFGLQSGAARDPGWLV